ncbi:MAG: cation diffusion facilitator family transporter [Ginsengibacter sp.]
MSSNHNHNHSHSHSHTIEPVDATAPFVIGIALNVLFVIVEVVAGIMNNSMSLLTDAGHNLSDVASLVLSLLAFRLAKKSSTKKFTYGFKKTTVLAAFLNAVLLLIAIGILGFESIRRLIHPASVSGETIAWVAGAGIVVNAITAFLFFKNRKADLNIKSSYMHMLSDTLVSVGVVVGGLLINFTGWNWIDPVIGLIIMVVILVGTWSLLADSFRLSVDAVPPDIDIEEIKNVITRQPNIVEAHHIHIWALSTTENALTAHISLDASIAFDEKMKLVKNLKHELMHHKIHHSTIEIETEEFGCAEKDC